MKRVTVLDLRPGERERFLFCPRCGAETSADLHDYFWMPAGQAFQCANGHRAVNVRLMTKHLVYELVKA